MAHGDEAYKIKEETIKLIPNILTIVCKLFVSKIAYNNYNNTFILYSAFQVLKDTLQVKILY